MRQSGGIATGPPFFSAIQKKCEEKADYIV